MDKKDDSYANVMRVIKGYSKSIENEKGIVLRGYGLHYAGPDKIYDGKIHTIDLGYCVDRNFHYKEARDLFYSVVDGLLEVINKNDGFSGFFFNFPVTYKDLYFRLNFDYDMKGSLKKDDINQICILENEILYFIVEEDGKSNELKQTKIVPDVYVLTDVLSNTRSIVRKLPEGPEALEDPTPEQTSRH